MAQVDFEHIQVLAAAGAVTSDKDLASEIEALLGRALDGSGMKIVLNKYDFYATPLAVVTEALDALDPSANPARILEPSAGTGAWLPELKRRWPNAKIDVVEKNPLNRLALQQSGANLVGEDFLAFTPDEPYDLIVGNPPFGDENGPLAYAVHIDRAMTMLTPTGQMMMIAPEGILFRSERIVAGIRLRAKTCPLPDKAFAESGTGVKTHLVWYSAADGLAPRFTKPAETEKPRSKQQDADTRTPEQVADSVLKLHRASDRVIDRFLQPKQKELFTDKTHEGWSNLPTWSANLAVMQNRTAYEAMRELLPRLTGSTTARCIKLALRWTFFCSQAGIPNDAGRLERTTGDLIEWDELLQEWDRAFGANA